MPSVCQSIIVCLVICLLGVACAPTQNVRGYFIDDVLIAEIKRGVDDKGSVLNVLGSPSNVSTFGTDAWYYISRKTESLAFFEKKVLDQRVVAIKFDDSGVVSEVQRYDSDDARAVAINERITPTRGKQLSLLQQLFGNLGRFSKQNEE
jgi:outer membrane protein assembly factor BamE (lipoprotein component of BamABCDE complex)